MKARVTTQASASIWLYLPGKDDAVTEAVQTAAVSCNVQFTVFGPELAGMRVTDILSGKPASAATEGNCPSEPVLLMDGLDKTGLDKLLAALREQFQTAGIPGIGLKAIVTPTNRSWAFGQLAEELRKEREFMQRGR